MAWQQWAPYVPVARRRANALREMGKLQKRGTDVQPIRIEGRTIARSFWGKGWCNHLESFSDYANRLPRGRTYVRNGSVCHLNIQPGRIDALVSGSTLYNIRINIKKLKPATWKTVKSECSGRIGSMLELLQGRLSDQVMAVVSDRKQGLFPQPSEIELKCDCPDWAVMCKHVAAVLYGVGSRLDSRPELLFLLRDVNADELISTKLAVPRGAATADTLADEQVGAIFGIELDDTGDEQPAPTYKSKNRPRANNRAGSNGRTEESSLESQRKAATAGSTRTRPRKMHQAPTTRKMPAPSANRVAPPHSRADTAVPQLRPTGRSMARLRARLGLSAAEFARQLGVAPASIYRWEATTGRLRLQARPLAALAKLQLQAGGR